ncbi:MAG: hypothetical protein ACYDCK_01045 [Thermoplasmatota archaeon]
MSDLRVCVLGFGGVAQALAHHLADDARGVRIVAVADRAGLLVDERGLEPRGLLAAKARDGRVGGDLSRCANDALASVDADVVVDLLPTNLANAEPSRSLWLAALANGAHVVTANKGPLALAGREIEKAARRAGRAVLASGSVCAGTPALELIDAASVADRVERIEGVLNGSTNFLLSRIETGVAWSDALAEAQRLGYLEADPSLDLLGLDAAAKGVILANRAWGPRWRLGDARVRGLTGVTAREALEARASGMALRLVVRASPAEGVSVALAAIPATDALVVPGRENVVRLKLEHAGTITLRGPGAGARETASAALADLVRVRDRSRGPAPPRIIEQAAPVPA